jgi:hypothetical protein
LAACQPLAGNNAATVTATVPPSRSPTPVLIASPIDSAATETLLPAPRAFTENFDGIFPYWEFVQVDNGQLAASPRAQKGYLWFELSGPNQWTYGLYGAQNYVDVRIEAHLEFVAGAQGAAGVVCRYGAHTGWYEFNIYADHTYDLLFGQWLTEGVARYMPLVRDESEKIQPGANEIGLSCQGDTLTPFINGTQLRRRQEKTFALANGKVGISAASFDSVPLTISYDWVRVGEP